MNSTKEKIVKRIRRHKRMRKHVHGTAGRPRLAVFRSVKHIYCQLIDDDSQRTLAAASTQSKEAKATLAKTTTMDAAAQIGRDIARKALEQGVKQIVFDRGGFRFHGRVKALAEGAREVFRNAGAPGF